MTRSQHDGREKNHLPLRYLPVAKAGTGTRKHSTEKMNQKFNDCATVAESNINILMFSS